MIILKAKLPIYLPNVKIKNASGLTNIPVHSPSYSVEPGVNSEHFGKSFSW